MKMKMKMIIKISINPKIMQNNMIYINIDNIYKQIKDNLTKCNYQKI
jgi:hypothetical protein